MNDYGFELLSDQPIPVDDSNVYELFSAEELEPGYSAKCKQRGNGPAKIQGYRRDRRTDFPGISR